MGFSLFKKIVSKKAGQTKDKLFGKKEAAKSRVDGGLPLDLYHGSKVTISMAEFALHRSAMIMQRLPKEMYVLAFAKFNASGLDIHRFYLGEETDVQGVLQIITDEKTGEIDECRVFTDLDEVTPNDAEEWGAWLDEGGLIGWEGFCVDAHEVEYGRAWEPDAGEYVEPMTFSETLNLDAYGEETTTVNHTAMLYGRHLDEEDEDAPAEYLFVSAEEHDDEALVHLMVGVDINPASIKVAF